MEGAKASLKEKFTVEQVPHMVMMLEGIALESFKRGLSDDLLYAMSVQEPTTLANALKIAQRIERDMIGSNDRKGNINAMRSESPSRQVHFKEDDYRDHRPWRSNSTDRGYNDNPTVPRNNWQRQQQVSKEESVPFRQHESRSREIGNRENYQSRSSTHQQRDPRSYSPSPNYRNRMPPVPYGYLPPTGYQYPPVPYGLMAPPAYAPYFYGMQQPMMRTKSQENLNEQQARRMDATPSQQTSERPPTVKFLSAAELQKEVPEEQQHH